MGRSTNSTRLDPVEAEARRIAAAALIVKWEDTESQARRVAEFAAVESITLKEQLDEMNEELCHPQGPPPDESDTVLYAMSLGGNLFVATDHMNKRLPELAPYCLQLTCDSPHNSSILVFKAPRLLVERLKEAKKIW